MTFTEYWLLALSIFAAIGCASLLVWGWNARKRRKREGQW